MRQFYFLLTFILFFFAENGYAQLTNGSQTLGGYGLIKTSYTKFVQSLGAQSSSSSYLGFSPTYGYYKNRFLVGAALGSSFDWNRSKSDIVLNSYDDSYHTFGYHFSPYLRYYTANNSKYAHFAFIEAGIYGTFSNRTRQVGNNTVEVNDPINFTWNAGFGAHKIITDQLVAEGILYYNSDKRISFSVNLRPFYKSFDAKNQDAPPQYIAKNRWQIDGGFSTGYDFNQESLSLGISAFGGKMVTNHFMIGSGLRASAGIPTDDNISYSSFTFSPFVRYYIPISNRFYAYPFIDASFYWSKNNSSSNYSNISFDRGIGLQYFLTRSFALTGIVKGAFERTKSNFTGVNGSAALTLGFSYFIK